MSLISRTPAEPSLKLRCYKLEELRALNAILAKDNMAFKSKEEVKSHTKKRKAVPQPAKKWRSAPELLAKGYTIEQLSEKTGEILEPVPVTAQPWRIVRGVTVLRASPKPHTQPILPRGVLPVA